MSAHILFLPSAGSDAGFRWLRVGATGIDARGEGIPVSDGEPSIVVVPAEDVTLHWAELPDRSAAQSVAAARLLIAEASATPLAELHVAVGREAGSEERPIGVVSASRMRDWLAQLAVLGIDPDRMIPAPMLLPRPEQGFIRADLGAGGVIRGPASGFADEPPLTELLTGGLAPEPMDRDAIEAAIAAAAAAPPLDLRQGPFARKRRTELDWGMIRRIGLMLAGVMLLTLMISLVEIMKYSFAADEIERRTELLARQGLPRGETVNDAESQLDARLVRLRGAGMGFSTTAAAVFGAVRGVPGSEVRGLVFDAKGELQVTLVTQTQGQIVDVVHEIEAQGFRVLPSTFENDGTRLTGRLTVAPK